MLMSAKNTITTIMIMATHPAKNKWKRHLLWITNVNDMHTHMSVRFPRMGVATPMQFP